MAGDGGNSKNLYIRTSDKGSRKWESVGYGTNAKWTGNKTKLSKIRGRTLSSRLTGFIEGNRRRAVYVKHKCTDGKRRYVRVGSVKKGQFRKETPKGKPGEPDKRLFREKKYGTKAENKRYRMKEAKDRYWE